MQISPISLYDIKQELMLIGKKSKNHHFNKHAVGPINIEINLAARI